MIKLTKMDGKQVAFNESFIENIAETPDTIITMHSGKSYVVKENIDEILKLITEFKLRTIGKMK